MSSGIDGQTLSVTFKIGFHRASVGISKQLELGGQCSLSSWKERIVNAVQTIYYCSLSENTVKSKDAMFSVVAAPGVIKRVGTTWGKGNVPYGWWIIYRKWLYMEMVVIWLRSKEWHVERCIYLCVNYWPSVWTFSC